MPERQLQLDAILEVLLQYTQKDFSSKLPISDLGDRWDAVCLGINSIGEELSLSLEELRNSNHELELRNSKLKQQQEELQQINEELERQTLQLKEQQEELEETNVELESQATKLQISEEELKAQHEELLQSNEELEEKSKLLEEKNNDILNKNIALQTASNELAVKAKQLELSSKYKSEFLANMSHELRTPLNSILLLSRLLADNNEENLTKDQIEFANVINNSGNGLLELINDILDLSKIEAGKMDLQFEEIEIASFFENIRQLFTHLAKSKTLDFQITIHRDVSKNIVVDRMRLEQIIKNLLSNAFKFTDKGFVHVTVSLPNQGQADRIGLAASKCLIYAVSDSGIGISKEKQDLIFEAFQQEDGSTKRKYGGTGLGLSISREIAHLLGGEIMLESEVGKGSNFKLLLPINCSFDQINQPEDSSQFEKNLLQEKERVREGLVIPKEIADDRSNLSAKDKVILIVEDDIGFAKALLKFSNKRGYKGIVDVSGANTLLYAEKYNPMAILLDIKLPVKGGWTIMKELKENQCTKHIPVHMMSAFEGNTIDSINAGAIDFISKPVSDRNLAQVFSKIEATVNTKPKTILLVDDNPIHITALKAYLTSKEKQCLVAENAKKAYEILNKSKVDCIVLDMGLPDENGYEVLEKIKTQKKFEKIPIIVYTGMSISLKEELKLKKYASAIVIKTVESYKRLLNEVMLFLHIVEHKSKAKNSILEPYLKSEALINKKVLIVDDDSRNIFSLTKLLEQNQMLVNSATDGVDALYFLNNNKKVDIILMDMMMPELDGYETIRKIRKSEKLKSIPIIAVTSKAMVGDREKCLEAGANDYITKPVDVDQLISLLRIWLNKVL